MARRRHERCSCGPPGSWLRPWPSSCRSTVTRGEDDLRKVELRLGQSCRTQQPSVSLQGASSHLRDVLVARRRQEIGTIDVAPAVRGYSSSRVLAAETHHAALQPCRCKNIVQTGRARTSPMTRPACRQPAECAAAASICVVTLNVRHCTRRFGVSRDSRDGESCPGSSFATETYRQIRSAPPQ